MRKEIAGTSDIAGKESLIKMEMRVVAEIEEQLKIDQQCWQQIREVNHAQATLMRLKEVNARRQLDEEDPSASTERLRQVIARTTERTKQIHRVTNTTPLMLDGSSKILGSIIVTVHLNEAGKAMIKERIMAIELDIKNESIVNRSIRAQKAEKEAEQQQREVM